MEIFAGSKKLVENFREIKIRQKDSAIKRTALVTLGASLIRVFEKKTKEDLLEVLGSVPIADLRKINSESKFETFYKLQLNRIERAVLKRNAKNKKLGKGLKWGHCTKVLSIFLREIVLRSRIFPDTRVDQLKPFLYAPLDSKVLRRLRKCGLAKVPHKINKLKTARQFWELQESIRKAAKEAGTFAIYLDDVWVEDTDQNASNG